MISVRTIPRVEPARKLDRPPPFYVEYALSKILRHANGLARQIDNRAHPVDEYANESTTSPEGLTTVTVQPTYDTMAERIESVLITGVPNTAFNLQLGDRYIQGITDTKGLYLLSPVSMLLGRNDPRVLTAALPAVSQPLSGVGSVTDPAAFAIIAQTPILAPGLYSVTGTVFLTGTVTSADANNMSIGNGIVGINIGYPGVIDVLGTLTITLYFAPGNRAQIFNTASASGAAAIYNATIAAVPLPIENQSLNGNWTLELMGWADERY